MMGHTNVRQKILEYPNRAEHGRRQRNQRPDQTDRAEFLERPIADQSTPPKRFNAPRYHQMIALATVSALGQVMFATVHAEGVVYESTVAEYEIGQIIASGEAIELPTGELIKILNRDGEQVIIREPTVFDPDNALSDPSPQPSAFEVAIWNQRRADIGGTRGDLERCLEAAQADPALDEADCGQFVTNEAPRPTFTITNAGIRKQLRPSQALHIKMVADFNAIASCRVHESENPSHSSNLVLGPNGTSTTRMLAGTPRLVPQRGVPAPKAPDQPGEYTLACIAVSSSAVDLFSKSMDEMTAQADRELLTVRFAEIRSEPVAFGTLTFTVTEN